MSISCSYPVEVKIQPESGWIFTFGDHTLMWPFTVGVQDCLEELNTIVGVTTTKDVLDVIFEQFWFGK